MLFYFHNTPFIITLLLFTSASSTFLASNPTFTEILPSTVFPVTFDSSHRTSFYKFRTNPLNNSPIVISFNKGNSITSTLYIYTSLSDISKNSNDEYINFKWAFPLNQATHIISQKDENYPSDANLYLVFHDKSTFTFSDSFTIYNEDSDIYLTDNTPYTISSFSGQKQYTFKYESNGNEVITLNTNLNNSSVDSNVFNQKIEIYHNDLKVLEVTGNDKNVIDFTNIQENYGKTPRGVYKVVVYNSISQENEINVTLDIMIFKSEQKVIEFKRATHKIINTLRTSNTTFQLFAYLSEEYLQTNTNCLNIKVGNYIINNNLLRNVYAYSSLIEETSDEQLQKYFDSIKELSTANYSTRINSDEHIQLCFKNDDSFNVTQHKVLFLQIELQSGSTKYIIPQEIIVSLSHPFEIINLDNIITYNNEKFIEREISFKTGMPFYILFKTNGRNDYSYVFNVQHSNISTLYNSFIINKDSKRSEYSQSNLYVINKGATKLYDEYYLEFFSENITFTKIIIQAIKTDIMFITNKRPIQSFFRNITNCAVPFYIIGKYDTNSESDERYFFVEEVTGKHDVLYNNSLDFEYMTKEGILPIKNFEYINQKVLLLSTKSEIIGIKCKSPGSVNIHFIDKQIKNTVSIGERIIGCVNNTQETKITLNEITEQTFNIRGASLSINDITIKVNSKTNELNIKNGYFFNEKISGQTSPIEISIPITSNSTQLPFVFEIAISPYENSFINISTSQKIPANTPLIYIPIEKSLSYKKLSISLSPCTNGCKFYFSKGTINTAVSPQLISTDISYSEKLVLIITNPYDKYQLDTSLYENDSSYYFAMWLNDTSIEYNIDLNYIQKEPLNPIKPGQIIILNQYNNKIAIVSDTDRNHFLNIVLKAYYDKEHHNKKNEIKLYYFDDEIDTIYFEDGYHVISQLNHGFELEIGIEHTAFNYSGVSFSYFFGEEYNPQKVEEINNHVHYILNDKFDNKIQWQEANLTELNDYQIIYEVYVIKQQSKHAKFIDNDIYLLELKENYQKLNNSEESDDDYYFYFETNTTEVTINLTGKFVVNVIAVVSGDIPIRLMYNYKEIEKSTFQDKTWFAIIFPCCFLISVCLIAGSLNADKCCVPPKMPTDYERLVPETLGPNQAPDLSGIGKSQDVSKVTTEYI